VQNHSVSIRVSIGGFVKRISGDFWSIFVIFGHFRPVLVILADLFPEKGAVLTILSD